MEIRELESKEEMLDNYTILTEVYPSLTLEQYSKELDDMLAHNYGQIGIYNGDNCLGITGYWIGTKLWCGKYIELDNVVISKKHRSKGVGKTLFNYMQIKAKEEDCTMIALDSYSDNFKAHKFFYAQGFIPRGFHFINILNKLGIR
ncbi:MAG: GNAT family N-acetyltransferase [Crocinitomicaceae bacterium]|jgi:GNAT superfamily N-acetyltransferase